MRISCLFISGVILASDTAAGHRENRSQHVARGSGHDATKYTYNWAGAGLVNNNGSYYGIAASFVVPDITGAVGSAVSTWVGIGGDECANIIQTGIEAVVGEDGVLLYDPWFEWYPSPTIPINNLTISAGDTIRLAISVYSNMTLGLFLIDNFSKPQMAWETFNTTNQTYTPCTSNADLIVEGYFPTDNNSVADFGQITFTDVIVYGPGREQYGLWDANVFYQMDTHDNHSLAYISSFYSDNMTISRGSG